MSLSPSTSPHTTTPQNNNLPTAIIPPSNKVSPFLKLPRQLCTIRTLHDQSHKMPLVVPQVSEDDQAAWAAKLLGKKLSDSSDNNSFAKQDLPEKHRIIRPGDMTTMDFVPNRLNVYVDDSEKVTKVKHG